MNRYAMAIVVPAFAALTSAASAEVVKVAHAFPQPAYPSQIDEFFAGLVQEATGGETKFEFFWGGSLGGGNEILHLIRDGAIQMGATVPGYYGSAMPVTGLINSLPFLSNDGSIARDVQDALSRSDPHFISEYRTMGVFPILQHALTPSHLMCTKPVRKIEDLSGLKIRTYGHYLPMAVNALGSTPVNMALTDVYEGLQRGVVDCVTINYAAAKAFKFHEVAKYWSTLNLGAISGPVLYTSFKNYKEGGWSSEFVAQVDDAASKAVAKERAGILEEDSKALAAVAALGVELIEFPDQARVDKAVPDMLGAWRDQQVKEGMDAATADAVVAAVRDGLAARQ